MTRSHRHPVRPSPTTRRNNVISALARFSSWALSLVLLLDRSGHGPVRGHVGGVSAFTLTMMGSRRGKGNLKRSLDPSSVGDGVVKAGSSGGVKALNGGKGQEITGVTLPEPGKIRGWAFGEDRTVACANINGRFYAVDGRCPRCGFDLYKGKLLVDEDVWGPDPRVACPTCATTYSLKTGKFGPELKQTGLAGFVNTWAKTATVNNASRDVAAFAITAEEGTGQVFCRER
mmetsp:Transcript_2107/g.4548  ORF Transcript_2107/g.4548 Transcript_2107/m.4548 type:complete len:231 (-) Transcript_2107:338-1030(-)